MLMDYLFFSGGTSDPSSVYASSTAAASLTEAEHARAETRQIRQDLHRYAVASQALWQLLRDKLGVTEDELRSMIQSIEQTQSRQASQGPLLCPHCHRPTGSHLPKCMYCGQDLGPRPLFDQ
jgi:hypothetical protein